MVTHKYNVSDTEKKFNFCGLLTQDLFLGIIFENNNVYT